MFVMNYLMLSILMILRQVPQNYMPQGLNIMYGDAQNNIAWFASGKLYKYRDSVNTMLVLDGASEDDEIQEYLDFEKEDTGNKSKLELCLFCQ